MLFLSERERTGWYSVETIQNALYDTGIWQCRETRVGHFYLYVPEWIQTEQGRKKKKKEKRQEKEHNEQTNNIEV